MRIKWSCDVGYIVDKNWIPSGTGEAVGIGRLHRVAAHVHALDKCITPCFLICVNLLINFRIYYFIASIILEWMWVPCVLWCVSTSYDIIEMDMSTLCILICIKLVMILLEWIKVPCVQRYTSIS